MMLFLLYFFVLAIQPLLYLYTGHGFDYLMYLNCVFVYRLIGIFGKVVEVIMTMNQKEK